MEHLLLRCNTNEWKAIWFFWVGLTKLPSFASMFLCFHAMCFHAVAKRRNSIAHSAQEKAFLDKLGVHIHWLRCSFVSCRVDIKAVQKAFEEIRGQCHPWTVYQCAARNVLLCHGLSTNQEVLFAFSERCLDSIFNWRSVQINKVGQDFGSKEVILEREILSPSIDSLPTGCISPPW